MRSSPSILLVALFALGVAVFVTAPATAHPSSLAGRPLLELHGQGIQLTQQAFPICIPCVPSNPHLGSWHVLVLADGRTSVSITRGANVRHRTAHTEAFLGSGDQEALTELRQALVDARIGSATGGCEVDAMFRPVLEFVELLEFDWQLTWYGRGGRASLLALPEGATEECEPELQRVVQAALAYVQSVRETASP